MAKLKSKYDKKEDVPAEALALELYEEKDGAWLLKKDAIEGVKTQADVDRVQGALKKEREAKEQAQATLKKFEALDGKEPDEITAMLDELEELRAEKESGGGKDKGKGEDNAKALREKERQIRDLTRERDKLKTDAETHRTRAEQLDGAIKTSKVEGRLTEVATAAKVRTEAIADIHMYKGLFEVDEDGKTIRTKDGVGVTPGLTPEEWISEQKQARPHWWPTSEGGGAKGGTGGGNNSGNPFAKGSFNFTEANKIAKADPGRAELLAKQAGFASVRDAVTAGATPAAPAK